MRRENRSGNVLDEATQVRAIEIAVAVSHNPLVWTAGRRVGWTEKIASDSPLADAIELSYDPLVTADKTLITSTKASEALLDAGRQRALQFTPDTKPALLADTQATTAIVPAAPSTATLAERFKFGQFFKGPTDLLDAQSAAAELAATTVAGLFSSPILKGDGEDADAALGPTLKSLKTRRHAKGVIVSKAEWRGEAGDH